MSEHKEEEEGAGNVNNDCKNEGQQCDCTKMLNVKTLLTQCSIVRLLCDFTDSGDGSSLPEAGK